MRRLFGAVASTAGWLSLGAGAYLLFGSHTGSAFDSVRDAAPGIGLVVVGLVLVAFARVWFRRYL